MFRYLSALAVLLIIALAVDAFGDQCTMLLCTVGGGGGSAGSTTPGYVQGCGSSSSEVGSGKSNTLSNDKCPFAQQTQAGNAILVFVSWLDNTTVSGVSDDAGDTFSAVASSLCDDTTQTAKGQAWLATNIAGGATYIKVSFTANTQYVTVEGHEFYNVAKSSAVDTAVCHQTAGTGGTSVTAGSFGAFAGAGELIVNAAWGDNGTTTSGWTTATQGGCPWTFRKRMILDAAPTATQWCVDSTTASFNPTMTSGSTIQYISVAVALKNASAGAGPPGFGVLFVQHDNNQSESATSVTQQVHVSGNTLVVGFNSGCNGSSTTDCAYVKSISSSPSLTWNQIGSNAISTCGTGSTNVNDSLSWWVASGVSPGDYTNTYTMNGRSTGGNGSTWMTYDVAGGASSPIDSTLGFPTGQTNQTGSSAPISFSYTVTPSQSGELLFSQLGLNYDSVTGITAPSGAFIIDAYYTGQINPTHNDLNAGFAVSQGAFSTITWAIDNGSNQGAGCSLGGTVGIEHQ